MGHLLLGTALGAFLMRVWDQITILRDAQNRKPVESRVAEAIACTSIRKSDIYRDFLVTHMRVTGIAEADVYESLNRLDAIVEQAENKSH